MEGGGNAARHIVVSVDEEQGRTVGDECEVNQRHQFAACHLKADAAYEHHDCQDDAGKSETVEEDGRVGHEILRCSRFDGQGEERDEAIADGR